jgi:hypothetical protein
VQVASQAAPLPHDRRQSSPLSLTERTDDAASPRVVDLEARDGGTVWAIRSLSRRARRWIEEHVQSETWQWLGDTLVIDHRYAWPLIEGMSADGLIYRAGGLAHERAQRQRPPARHPHRKQLSASPTCSPGSS